MRFAEDFFPMGQSILHNPSRARLVETSQASRTQEPDDRPIQEIIAQRVSQRSRRRLIVAVLPLIFVTVLLVYVLAFYRA